MTLGKVRRATARAGELIAATLLWEPPSSRGLLAVNRSSAVCLGFPVFRSSMCGCGFKSRRGEVCHSRCIHITGNIIMAHRFLNNTARLPPWATTEIIQDSFPAAWSSRFNFAKPVGMTFRKPYPASTTLIRPSGSHMTAPLRSQFAPHSRWSPNPCAKVHSGLVRISCSN